MSLLPIEGARAQSSSADVVAGELRIFAGNFVPVGWLPCSGEEIDVLKQPALARAIGKTFGGAGKTHDRVPDLRGRALIGSGDPPGGTPRRIGEHGKALAVSAADKDPSSLGITYLIASRGEVYGPLIGEVRAFSFPFAPLGWLVCDGGLLSVSQHPQLYSIIGSRFGGRAQRLPFQTCAAPPRSALETVPGCHRRPSASTATNSLLPAPQVQPGYT